jgi:hypothetical protein
MAPYDVWYISPKTGKHKFRMTHTSYIDALKHSINLGGCDVTEDGGLFSYVTDKQTGMVAKGNKWIPFNVAFPKVVKINGKLFSVV